MKMNLFAKIGMLFVALAGVLYFMKSLDSGRVSQELMDPDNTLHLLLGADEKITNWCPQDTIEVEVYSADGSLRQSFTAPVDVSSLCEVLVGSFNNDGLDEKSYQKRLRAKNKVGDFRELEQIPEKPIFKVQGLPFRSPMLLKNIADRIKP